MAIWDRREKSLEKSCGEILEYENTWDINLDFHQGISYGLLATGNLKCGPVKSPQLDHVAY